MKIKKNILIEDYFDNPITVTLQLVLSYKYT